MLYFSGAERRPHGPVMLTPMMGHRLPDHVTWAVDTGCFAKPEKYDTEAYLYWLWQRREHRGRCIFATAPDVFGDGIGTLKKSKRVLPLIRSVGFPAALVLQPGMTMETVPWDEIDAVFIGGPDDWHVGPVVADIVHEANRRGLWTHEGRVNSLRRLRAAQAKGCKSADGTFVIFGPKVNLPRMHAWLDELERQPLLL